MSELKPEKLHVTIQEGTPLGSLQLPRCYTLTHSDFTGDLFLTIGAGYNRKQTSGLYTRLMRDEVLAEWKCEPDETCLHVHVHVSGGIVVGTAGWRNDILHYHMPLVLEALRHGDRQLYAANPKLETAPVRVHFASHRKRYNQSEDWGPIGKYRIPASPG